MLQQIQELILQIQEFVMSHEGFSIELAQAGAVINVTTPDGTTTSYDGYELLLYTLSSRKLGHEIKLNVNSTEDGKKVFAVNSDASLNLNDFILSQNRSTLVYPDEIHAVVLSVQTSDSPFPYCVGTFFSNGKWLRYDLTMPELLYAACHGLELEEQEDQSFAYTKLRDLSNKLREELNAALSK
jgi:hypothetical protein